MTTDFHTQAVGLDPDWQIDRFEVTESGVTITVQRWPGIPNGWRIANTELDRYRDLIVRVASDEELLSLAKGVARAIAAHRRALAAANQQLDEHLTAVRTAFGPPAPATSTTVAAG